LKVPQAESRLQTYKQLPVSTVVYVFQRLYMLNLLESYVLQLLLSNLKIIYANAKL